MIHRSVLNIIVEEKVELKSNDGCVDKLHTMHGTTTLTILHYGIDSILIIIINKLDRIQ